MSVLATMFATLEALVFRRSGHSRLSAFAIALIALIFGMFSTGWLSQAWHAKPADDTHAWTSSNEATAWVYCGKYGYLLNEDRDTYFGVRKIRDQGIASALAAEHQSISRYCANVQTKSLNNENTLMLLFAAAVASSPDGSVGSVAGKMALIRACMLLFSLYIAARVGVGLVAAAFVSSVVGTLLYAVQSTHVLSLYPFLTVLPVFTPAVVTACFVIPTLQQEKRYAHWRMAIRSLACGAVLALVLNLRTSYGITMGLEILATLVFLLAYRIRRMRDLGLAAGLLAAGVVAFHIAFIKPLAAGTGYNYSYHSVWHPIVLGLDLPRNQFAEALGIEWNDAVGLELAKKIDPSVIYLGPTYDASLRKYYFSLWAAHPIQMIHLYLYKAFTFASVFPKPFHTLNTVVTNGYVWFYSLFALGALLFAAIRDSRHFCGLAMITICGVALLSLEQVIVIPEYYPGYQAGLLAGYLAAAAFVISALFMSVLRFAFGKRGSISIEYT